MNRRSLRSTISAGVSVRFTALPLPADARPGSTWASRTMRPSTSRSSSSSCSSQSAAAAKGVARSRRRPARFFCFPNQLILDTGATSIIAMNEAESELETTATSP